MVSRWACRKCVYSATFFFIFKETTELAQSGRGHHNLRGRGGNRNDCVCVRAAAVPRAANTRAGVVRSRILCGPSRGGSSGPSRELRRALSRERGLEGRPAHRLHRAPRPELALLAPWRSCCRRHARLQHVRAAARVAANTSTTETITGRWRRSGRAHGARRQRRFTLRIGIRSPLCPREVCLL